MSTHRRIVQIAVAAGVTLAGLAGSSAVASGQENEARDPNPGMERMDDNQGMRRMHELMEQGNPGMAQMHSRMMS